MNKEKEILLQCKDVLETMLDEKLGNIYRKYGEIPEELIKPLELFYKRKFDLDEYIKKEGE